MEDEEIITPRGPSEAAWQHYKKTIIDLYRNRKLKDVMREMEQRYKFVSTYVSKSMDIQLTTAFVLFSS